MRRVVGFAVAICAGFAAPAAASAIDFDAMPVGCSWVIAFTNGTTWRETYLGLRDGQHETETRTAQGGNLVSRKTFNPQGYMIERRWQDGKWERFAPYSCYGQMGSCRYTYTNADGARMAVKGTTRRSGRGFAVSAGVEGGDAYPDEFFVSGPYGLMVENTSSNFSSRIVSFDRCGAVSS